MFSDSRNDLHLHVSDRLASNCLRDHTNPAGISDNTAKIGDNAAGIFDIAVKVIPCWTPSRMETGVTLFLEDKFQSGCHSGCKLWGHSYHIVSVKIYEKFNYLLDSLNVYNISFSKLINYVVWK